MVSSAVYPADNGDGLVDVVFGNATAIFCTHSHNFALIIKISKLNIMPCNDKTCKMFDNFFVSFLWNFDFINSQNERDVIGLAF